MKVHCCLTRNSCGSVKLQLLEKSLALPPDGIEHVPFAALIQCDFDERVRSFLYFLHEIFKVVSSCLM